jgi:hypothetical protein
VDGSLGGGEGVASHSESLNSAKVRKRVEEGERSDEGCCCFSGRVWRQESKKKGCDRDGAGEADLAPAP